MGSGLACHYPLESMIDPHGAVNDEGRIVRGGAWDSIARSVRVASVRSRRPVQRPRLPLCPCSGAVNQARRGTPGPAEETGGAADCTWPTKASMGLRGINGL